MKLVREHINEKFSEESDPIRDMGIGGVSMLKEFNKEYKETIRKYKKLVKTFEGKTVSGKMIRYYVSNGTRLEDCREYTIKVKKAELKEHASSGSELIAIYFETEDNNEWYEATAEKLFIKG